MGETFLSGTGGLWSCNVTDIYSVFSTENVAAAMNNINNTSSRTYYMVRKMKLDTIQGLTLKVMVDGVRLNKGTDLSGRVSNNVDERKNCTCSTNCVEVIKNSIRQWYNIIKTD